MKKQRKQLSGKYIRKTNHSQTGAKKHIPGHPFSSLFLNYLCPMETNRQKKIARLLQKDLGEIIQIEGRGWFPGVMITVTQVKVTSDLSIARVYVSIFGKESGEVIRQIEMRGKEIRKLLGLRVKNQLRQIPELRFYIDDSLDYIENIEKLLKE